MGKYNKEIHLSDYWKIIIERKLFVLSFMSSIVLIASIYTFMKTPTYIATAVIAIDRESTISPVTGKRMDFENRLSETLDFKTHLKLIKSRPVIVSLIQSLDETLLQNKSIDSVAINNSSSFENDNGITKVLYQIRLLSAQLKKITAEAIREYFPKDAKILTDEEILDLRVKSMKGQIAIANVPETRLVYISSWDRNPDFSATVANSLAKKYIEFDLSSRLATANQKLEWLNKELFALKQRLEEDQRKFYEYKQSNKVFSLQGKQKIINQKISELNNEYLNTKTKRQELDAILEEISHQVGEEKNIGHIRSVLNNPAIDRIHLNVTNLELEQSRLKKVFKSKHPKMIQVTTEIDKALAKLQTELEREVENLKVQRKVLFSREKVMEANLAEFEGDALSTSGKELKYTMLQRNMDTSQNLHDTLVTKIKEVAVITGAAASNVRIVEEAAVPIVPLKPNKRKNIILAILVGLFGGIIIVFFLDYMDQSIRNEEDAQYYLNLPVLSIIPVAEQQKKGGYSG